jgi:hypothetical protein
MQSEVGALDISPLVIAETQSVHVTELRSKLSSGLDFCERWSDMEIDGGGGTLGRHRATGIPVVLVPGNVILPPLHKLLSIRQNGFYIICDTALSLGMPYHPYLCTGMMV